MKKVYYRDWDEMPVILTIAQCAMVLQVAERTVTDWAISGKLPAHKVGGKNWRVAKEDLKNLFERSTANV